MAERWAVLDIGCLHCESTSDGSSSGVVACGLSEEDARDLAEMFEGLQIEFENDGLHRFVARLQPADGQISPEYAGHLHA